MSWGLARVSEVGSTGRLVGLPSGGGGGAKHLKSTKTFLLIFLLKNLKLSTQAGRCPVSGVRLPRPEVRIWILSRDRGMTGGVGAAKDPMAVEGTDQGQEQMRETRQEAAMLVRVSALGTGCWRAGVVSVVPASQRRGGGGAGGRGPG